MTDTPNAMLAAESSEPKYIAPYEGYDMASYIMERGFKLSGDYEDIKSITNVRHDAIIVTESSVWRVKPMYQIGFRIELLARI